MSETTRKRLSEIDRIIEAEAGRNGHVHDAVVRNAIEDVAGHSDPTIRRYRTMLEDRGYLYPHPDDESRYALTERDFVAMTQQLRENGIIDDGRYWDMVGHIGEDRFRTVLDEHVEPGPEKSGFH